MIIAAKAHKLSSKGDLTGRELADKLGLKYAAEAHDLANIGRAAAARESHRLTDSEMLLLRCLAAEERALLDAGRVGSPTSPRVAQRARKASGWPAATAAKRLGTHRKGEDERSRGSGLNLVSIPGNGHLWLTPAGWALIHAIEAAIVREADEMRDAA